MLSVKCAATVQTELMKPITLFLNHVEAEEKRFLFSKKIITGKACMHIFRYSAALPDFALPEQSYFPQNVSREEHPSKTC